MSEDNNLENQQYETLLKVRRLAQANVTGTEIASMLNISTGLVSRYQRIAQFPDLVERIRDKTLSMNKAVVEARDRVNDGEGEGEKHGIVVRTHRNLPTMTVNVPGKGKVIITIDQDFEDISFEWAGKQYIITATERGNSQ